MKTGNNTTKKDRIALLDNMKGILITLVVFAHFLYEYQELYSVRVVVNAIYFFHMPVFVFTTGFLSKGINSRNKRSIIKLLIIYFLFNGLLMLGIGRNSPNAMYPYKSMWYILAVIIWRLSADSLSHVKHIFPLTILGAFIVGFWSSINNAFALARTIAFLPFFMAGYLVDPEKFREIFLTKKKSAMMWGGICLIISWLVWDCCNRFFDYSQYQYLMESYKTIGDIIARIAMFIVSTLVLLAMLWLIPNKQIPLLSRFGKKSLYIYLLHYPVVLVFRKIYMVGSESALYIFSLIGTIILVFLFSTEFVTKLSSYYFETATKLVCGEETGRKGGTLFVKISCAIYASLIILLPIITYCVKLLK